MNSLVNKPSYLRMSDNFRLLSLALLLFCAAPIAAQYGGHTSCEDFDLSVFDGACLDSLSKVNVHYDDHVVQVDYSDVTSAPECVWRDFKGHFDIDKWRFHADNYDGKLHSQEAPHSIKIEGASHSPTNNHRRYVASLKIDAPTSGYVAFDWSSGGGSFPHIDAFYFTVNDSCVQLSNLQVTEGHFVSWHLEKGDIISLEQVSNGTYNHITTTISHWKFIPDVYQVIDRHWRFVDAYHNEVSCKQHIEITRPALDAFIIPMNRDGYDAPTLSCEEDIIPNAAQFPYYPGIKGNTFLSYDPINDFSAQYEDHLISKCGGNKTINRVWTLRDHCSDASINRSQILKIVDDSKIEIDCPADQTFNINRCEVSVYIRQPRAWSACNDDIHVEIEWAYGSGSKIYSGVTPGRYEIKFTAKDGCGKEEVCSMWLDLVYHSEDIFCKENVEYTLPNTGSLRINATDLITGGSSCSELNVKVDGQPYLDLDCSDLGWKTYTVTYYERNNPSQIKTCNVEINLIGQGEQVVCKNDVTLDLPSSGTLRIPVTDLVDVQSSVCTNLIFEINGKTFLDLDCSDLGVNSFQIKYYNPNNPSDIQSCDIYIKVIGESDVVLCKSNLNYALPASGTLVIPISDLIDVQPSVCSNLIFEVEGQSSLTLDCADLGSHAYTVKYYDPSDPNDFETCDVYINLSGDLGSVECKSSLNYTLPNSGSLSIPVGDLVNIKSSVCTNLVLEVEGGSYLNLSCADIGSHAYTVKYYDPADPNDFETCDVYINLSADLGSVECKSPLNFTLPNSGTLSIPVGELVNIQSAVCTNLVLEVEGTSYLDLSCADIGSHAYTVKYYDPADPYDFETCEVYINLSGDLGSVECKTYLDYTLPISGTLSIPVGDLVNIQSSVCTNLVLEVEGGSYLDLSCSDVGTHSYTVKYYNPTTPDDIHTCSVSISLTGGSSGSLHCPSDTAIPCGTDISDLSVFGLVSAPDIDPSEITYNENRQLNACGIGKIIRTWSTTAYCGGPQSCSQTIIIFDDVSDIIIQWPTDYTIDGCAASQDLAPEYLPTEFAYPTVDNQTSCGMITFNYSDSNNSGTGDCFVVNRNWVATNTCDPSWSQNYTQRLEVKDIEKPVLSLPEDINIQSGSESCTGAYISVPLATAQDCDTDVVITNNSIYADQNAADASGTYPVGLTTVTFTARDKCDNYATGTITITVEATGSSELTCIGEFDVFLAKDAFDNIGYTLSASQLVTSSSTSCDGSPFVYAFAEHVEATTLEMDCSDIGLKAVDVFRYDGSNWTSCTAWVRTSDPSGHCSPDASLASISGKVTTEEGKAVKYVEVMMDGLEGSSTDSDGTYFIGNIPTGISHSIHPRKEINFRNGINTLDMIMLNRHLLGTRYITSPYKIIACDLNNSNSVSVGDLYLMNGLVIATINELDRSWKFIPEGYVFPDPTDPFAHTFPESLDMQVNADMSNQNFIAVKSGDPNHSADPKKLMGMHESDGSIVMKTIDQHYVVSEQVEVTLEPQLQQHLEGMQFTLEFDPQHLSLDEIVETFGLGENLVINKSRIDFGEIGVVFVNYNVQEEIAPLKLKFTALKDGTLSKSIKISSLIYKSEGYFKDEIVPVELQFVNGAEDELEIAAMPNPFRDVLNLAIYSPDVQKSTLTIMDITGRKVAQKTIALNKGDNTYEVGEKEFENAGIYLLQLHVGSTVQQLKVVKID